MPIVSTPEFYPERLNDAVKARALTWKDLSDASGVRQNTLSDYKKGKSVPSPEQLDKLAEALDFPKEYFVRQPNFRARLVGPRLFRAPAANTRRAAEEAESRLAWLAECIILAERWLNIPEPSFLSQYKAIDDPFLLSDNDIEAIALSVRQKLGFGEKPIRKLLRTLEKTGIPVIKYEGLVNNQIRIDALSQHTASGRPLCIIFSRDEPALARENFSLAHELGHIVLHHSVKDARFDSPSDAKVLEDQANRFASAFLLPSRSFLADLSTTTLHTFKFLKPKWQVSISSMIMRAAQLRVIDRAQTSSLFVMLSQRRWRTKEPLDDVLAVEEPILLKQIFQMLKKHKGLSGDYLCDELALNPRDIAAISGLSPQDFLPTPLNQDILSIKKYSSVL